MRGSDLFAWAGGGVFVASLAYTTWWYLVPLGVDRPFAGGTAIAWNAALLTLFACHHSIFARERVKKSLARLFGERVKSVYVWIASLLLAAVCIMWRPVGATLFDAGGIVAVACAALQVMGLALIAASVARIDALDLAGIRQTEDRTPRDPTRPVPEPLQIVGPYRVVRHPLYFGWMLATFGTHHLTGDRLTFAALTAIYLVVAVRWEERSLRLAFGDAYARYAVQVPWRVIPFIY